MPLVIVTDKLRSYGAAKRHLLPEIAPPGAELCAGSTGRSCFCNRSLRNFRRWGLIGMRRSISLGLKVHKVPHHQLQTNKLAKQLGLQS
jgi:hypothetical protein